MERSSSDWAEEIEEISLSLSLSQREVGERGGVGEKDLSCWRFVQCELHPLKSIMATRWMSPLPDPPLVSPPPFILTLSLSSSPLKLPYLQEIACHNFMWILAEFWVYHHQQMMCAAHENTDGLVFWYCGSPKSWLVRSYGLCLFLQFLGEGSIFHLISLIEAIPTSPQPLLSTNTHRASWFFSSDHPFPPLDPKQLERVLRDLSCFHLLLITIRFRLHLSRQCLPLSSLWAIWHGFQVSPRILLPFSSSSPA